MLHRHGSNGSNPVDPAGGRRTRSRIMKVPVCFQCFLGWSNRTKPEPKPVATSRRGNDRIPASDDGGRTREEAAHDIGIHNQTA